jgi:tetratricopeptide (TPR) repeat protein
MEYLGLLVFPATLRADYWLPEVPIARSLLEPGVLAALAFGILLGGLALYGWRRARPLFFSIAFYCITLLPVSNLLFPIGVAKAERFLYLPSVGFCLVAGWAGARAAASVQARRLAAVPLAMVLVLFAWRTASRNREWKSDFDLALATLKVSPTSPLMNAVAAAQYRARGQAARAIPLLQEAIRQRPGHAPLSWELGLSYFQEGMIGPAMEAYRHAIRLKPDYSPAHASLAEAYMSGNQFDEAIGEFQSALRQEPENAALHNNLGTAYTRKGALELAIGQYRLAIALRDDYWLAHLNLAGAYVMSGRLDEAIDELGIVLRLDPANAQAHHLLGTAYFRKGAFERAIQEYDQALGLKPDWLEARRDLEEARARLKTATTP